MTQTTLENAPFDNFQSQEYSFVEIWRGFQLSVNGETFSQKLCGQKNRIICSEADHWAEIQDLNLT